MTNVTFCPPSKLLYIPSRCYYSLKTPISDYNCQIVGVFCFVFVFILCQDASSNIYDYWKHLCLISRIHVTQFFMALNLKFSISYCCINLFHFTFNTYMQCIQENKGKIFCNYFSIVIGWVQGAKSFIVLFLESAFFQ